MSSFGRMDVLEVEVSMRVFSVFISAPSGVANC